MKFNLASYLGLKKEAMGAARFSNRPPLEVWDFDKLKNAPEDSQDPDVLSFRQWVEAVPSLGGILDEARVRQNAYYQKIKEQYGMGVDKSQHIFKQFIGYEPTQGGYILFVGPYLSTGERWGREHVRQEGVDKFIGTTLCFAPNSIRNSKAALDKLVKKLNKAYEETSQGEPTGLVFDENDFKLIDREPKQTREDGKVVKGQIRQEINNIGDLEALVPNPYNDPEIEARNQEIREQNAARNPEAVDFFEEKELTPNAGFVLNENGYEKMMQNLMGPWYSEVMQEKIDAKMAAENIPADVAREQVAEEYRAGQDNIMRFYNEVRGRWQNAFKAKDPVAMQMIASGFPQPPTFKNHGLSKSSGQQTPREIRANDDVRDVLNFRKRIINLIKAGKADVDEIDEAINAGLADKNKIPKNKIAYELNKIAELRRIVMEEGREGSYDDILAKINAYLGELTTKGYNDFRTAFEMLSAFLNAPPTMKLPEQHEFQTKNLSELRQLHQEDLGLEEGAVLAPEEVEEDIGQAQLPPPEQEKIEVDPLAPAPVPQPLAPAPQQQQPQQEEQEEEDDLLKLLNYTVKNLIRVARELDDEGKGEAAEEVHKVIRKYQKRII